MFKNKKMINIPIYDPYLRFHIEAHRELNEYLAARIEVATTHEEYLNFIISGMNLFREYQNADVRISILKMLLTHLIANKIRFTSRNKNFEIAVENRLIFFYFQENWEEANDYYRLLFNKDIREQNYSPPQHTHPNRNQD